MGAPGCYADDMLEFTGRSRGASRYRHLDLITSHQRLDECFRFQPGQRRPRMHRHQPVGSTSRFGKARIGEVVAPAEAAHVSRLPAIAESGTTSRPVDRSNQRRFFAGRDDILRLFDARGQGLFEKCTGNKGDTGRIWGGRPMFF